MTQYEQDALDITAVNVLQIHATANFEANLQSIEIFWVENNWTDGYDRLLNTLEDTVINSLRRHPFIGHLFSQRHVNSPDVQLVYDQLSAQMKVTNAVVSFREFLIPNYVILYAVVTPASQALADIYLLAIKHDKQLRFDLANEPRR